MYLPLGISSRTNKEKNALFVSLLPFTSFFFSFHTTTLYISYSYISSVMPNKFYHLSWRFYFFLSSYILIINNIGWPVLQYLRKIRSHFLLLVHTNSEKFEPPRVVSEKVIRLKTNFLKHFFNQLIGRRQTNKQRNYRYKLNKNV